MLQVHNLTAGYGPLTVLNDVSLSLTTGARLGVFGHNGAGKTTLLRCIVGALHPRQGKVDVEGVDTSTATVAENVRRGIAFVPQGHNVFPNLTVAQNLHIAGLLFDPSFITQVGVGRTAPAARGLHEWRRAADAGAWHGVNDKAKVAPAR